MNLPLSPLSLSVLPQTVSGAARAIIPGRMKPLPLSGLPSSHPEIRRIK